MEQLKSPAKKNIDWRSRFNNRFIEYWQAIFNRRISSCGPFALQVGDVLIFLIPLAFVIFCFVFMTDQSNSGVMAEIVIGKSIRYD